MMYDPDAPRPVPTQPPRRTRPLDPNESTHGIVQRLADIQDRLARLDKRLAQMEKALPPAPPTPTEGEEPL